MLRDQPVFYHKMVGLGLLIQEYLEKLDFDIRKLLCIDVILGKI